MYYDMTIRSHSSSAPVNETIFVGNVVVRGNWSLGIYKESSPIGGLHIVPIDWPMSSYNLQRHIMNIATMKCYA